MPVSCLIPEGLQGIYDKLVTRAANGDSAVTANMQHLMWALRTAGTDAAYANNITSEQRRILDSCSEYAGEFEDFCSNERARAQLLGWLIAKVDARLNINIGGVSYKASDLLDPDVGAKKIDAHLQQLIDLGEMVPIEHIGFNYGELEKGIYTDVMGTGPLKFRATVANATSQPFVFYPQRYVGQAGSDVSLSSSAITFSATANDAKVQRVTSGPVDEVGVVGGSDQPDPQRCTCVQRREAKMRIWESPEYEKKRLICVVARGVQGVIFSLPLIGDSTEFFYRSYRGGRSKDDGFTLGEQMGFGAKIVVKKYITLGLPDGWSGNGLEYRAFEWANDTYNWAGETHRYHSASGDVPRYIRDLDNDYRKLALQIDRLVPKCPVHGK